MKVCVIGGANVDITATSRDRFIPGDSNPGTVRLSFGGDALLAGIVHAGPDVSVAESARVGLLCARCAVESEEAVNENLKYLKL